MSAIESSPLTHQRAAEREGALLEVRRDLVVFPVTGGERLSWLNGLVTCDIGKLTEGSAAYGFSVTKTGKVMTELWILGRADDVLVIVPRAQAESIRKHIDHHLIMEDAEIGDALARIVLFVHGPLSAELAERARSAAADAAVLDWTGRGPSALVILEEQQLDALTRPLLETADGRYALATEDTMSTLHLEWGVPRFGVDYDGDAMPHEASLEKIAVSFSKGCYLGQEAVFMLEKRGHARRRLVRIGIEGREPVARGAEIALGTEGTVGEVTGATPDPEGEGTLALGFVKYKHANAGTAVTVAERSAKLLGLAATLQRPPPKA